MKTLLSTVMRKATELTCAQNAIEATRLIQRALAKRPSPPEAQPPGWSLGIEQLPGEAKDGRHDGPESANESHRAAPLRRPLGEVLTLLRQGESPGFGLDAAPFLKPRKAPAVPVPDGAAFLSRSFTCEAGSRDYKVYVPSHAKSRQRPLLIMLHGCTQNPDDFALGTQMNGLAEEHGFIAAYPRQALSANQSACWNWFSLNDQQRDAGEPCIIAGITRTLMAEFGIDARRVFVAGLSAGGAMAAVMSAAYPELYSATGIHSGLAYGSASDVVSAFAAMKGTPVASLQKRPAKSAKGQVRTIVFQGAADQTVHPLNAERIVAAARAGLKSSYKETQQEGSARGRAYTHRVIADPRGIPYVEYWAIEGLAHAWSGGSPEGSYTDPQGPDASREMLRFFLACPAKHPAW